MSTDAPALAIDPEMRELLDELGIDQAGYLKRQAELAAYKPSPEAAAKLAAEQEALRPAIEAYNAFIDRYGLMSEALQDE